MFTGVHEATLARAMVQHPRVSLRSRRAVREVFMGARKLEQSASVVTALSDPRRSYAPLGVRSARIVGDTVAR